MLRKLVRQIRDYSQDANFLKMVGGFETLVAKVLSLMMLVVILVALYDLIKFLAWDILQPPFGFSSITLIELFGLFLNILIALEILENITAYLKKHVIQLELVIITSLIAVARKIIILDLQKTTGVELIGLAIAIFALSISYWIIHYTNHKPSS